MYYTIIKTDYGLLIDSISKDFNSLKLRFPDQVIYESEDPIVSIWVLKENLHIANGN